MPPGVVATKPLSVDQQHKKMVRDPPGEVEPLLQLEQLRTDKTLKIREVGGTRRKGAGELKPPSKVF